MIEKIIDIDGDLLSQDMPAWANNFLTTHEILFTLKVLPKDKRSSVIEEWRKNENMSKNLKLEDLMKIIRIDNDGKIIFHWNTEPEMTMFILKWSN